MTAGPRRTPPTPPPLDPRGHDLLQAARQASADGRARLSFWLGCAALLGGISSVPAVVVGVTALQRASPAGRRRAWAGVALGVGFALAWAGGAILLLVLAARGYYAWLDNPDVTTLPGPLFLDL